MPVDQATAADLVARVEAHLRQHPEDGRGWDVLAPVYLRMGDYTQAADAFL
jgi:cytochrome c-type biogenesis protein CcmH